MMKGTVFTVAVFVLGCIAGWNGFADMEMFGDAGRDLPMYLLYILMFLVGISVGSNPDLKKIVKSVSPKILLLPLVTVLGTLAFSALAGILIAGHAAYFRREVHLFEHYSYHDRNTGGELVHAETCCSFSHFPDFVLVIHDYEMPWLGIACRGSQPGCFQTFGHQSLVYIFHQIFSGALSFQYQFLKIHFCSFFRIHRKFSVLSDSLVFF